MRISLFLAAALLPLSGLAQDGSATPDPKPATELAVNAGVNALDTYSGRFAIGSGFRGSVSILRSRGRFQYGLTVEGAMSGDWYLAPGVVANYRRLQKAGYWYAGAMAGYNRYTYVDLPAAKYSRPSHGFVIGLQSGYTRQIRKRLAVNAEAGIRSSILWRNVRAVPSNTNPDVDLSYTIVDGNIYAPVTIGIRYTIAPRS